MQYTLRPGVYFLYVCVFSCFFPLPTTCTCCLSATASGVFFADYMQCTGSSLLCYEVFLGWGKVSLSLLSCCVVFWVRFEVFNSLSPSHTHTLLFSVSAFGASAHQVWLPGGLGVSGFELCRFVCSLRQKLFTRRCTILDSSSIIHSV